MRYLLVIPAGGALRNFLCTPFLEHLLESGDVVIWHMLQESHIASHRERWGSRVQWQFIPGFTETLLERIFRQAKNTAHIYWRYPTHIDLLLRRVRPSGSWLNRNVGRLAETVGRMCATEQHVTWLDRMHERAAGNGRQIPSLKKELLKIRPDVVFCVNQRALRAVPIMAAARKLGIPTATFIYSWDNLPKSRIAVPSEYFLVWSEYMARELKTYYPQLAPSRVKVVGTPQFEHYANRHLIRSRESFFESLKLDPARPVVCFSGDDYLTSPHDQLYLADLAASIRQLGAKQAPQILFRPCPTDRSNRFDPVLKEYPEIVRSNPLWEAPNANDWSQVIPSREDNDLLMNIVYHSQAVVNVGSTMAMDFAIYDKPGIYISYNQPSGTASWNIHEIYRLPHFKTVHDFQPIYWARSPKELGDQVLRALNCPQEKTAARKAWLENHVKQPIEHASKRFSNALQEIASASNTYRTGE